MTVQNLIEKAGEIPADVRVRVLYESIPWTMRQNFSRKIMDPGIKPIRPDMAVCGPAYTIADAHMSLDMIADICKEGCVLVIQTSGCQGTFMGDFMRELAEQDGALGVVTDGYVTHAAALIKKDFPVFARGSRIQFAGYELKGSVQVPITCGGVLVNPGDFIIGNLDGVMVFTAAQLEDLLDKSQWIMKVVDVLLNKYMRKGVRYIDVPGVREFWDHKATGSKNEDEFYKEWVQQYGD